MAGRGVDAGVLAVVRAALGAPTAVSTPSPVWTGVLASDGHQVTRVDLRALPQDSADSVVLGDDELSRAGDGAEGLVAAAADALRPGGLLVASARNPLRDHDDGLRGFASEQLRQALEHRGFVVDVLAAPGAAARVADGCARGTAPDPVYDPVADRMGGLLDAGDRVVAVARAPLSERHRSEVFYDTIPRKLVAAAILCRDAEDRVLVVHDRFRDHWTIPGGVVDAREDPRTGAVREAWEESGVRVRPAALLGVFAAPVPDRLLLVYDAVPLEPAPHPVPVQSHEISAARWLPLDEALALLNPGTRGQVMRCLESPGQTWPDR